MYSRVHKVYKEVERSESMECKKRFFNTKGQEGITIGTLLLLVLGIVVVVVLIIGATTGFDYIFSKFKILPGQNLQAVVKACETSADLDLSVDYCSFKKIKIDSKNEYLNCEDTRVRLGMKADLRDAVKCELINGDTQGELQCIKLMENKEYNIKINGVLVGNNNSDSINQDARRYCTAHKTLSDLKKF